MRSFVLEWTSSMKLLVTSTTEDQRFSATGGHDFDPIGFLSAFISAKVFKCTYMMHL
ncbi:hypothetical protein KSC_031220 [Ktedonobacter sp. SOSP1-52]|nr:hypothetical protein KSC_031220 [Ktedonobacter sp. SOSP1-52]